MDPFIQKLISFGEEHQMFSKRDHVLVALSGGPDSIALLFAMMGIRKKYSIELSIAHLNHCARGQESNDDSEFVRKIGNEFNLPTYIQKENIEEKKVQFKSSFQDTARQIRNEYLMTVLQKIGGSKIALGHNMDDQAETILMNFLRGSGTAGLKGMLPMRDPWIRPLLNFKRSEILGFLESKEIPYRVDSSNVNKKYLRNKIRVDLIPFLASQYNPNLIENLSRMASTLSGENAFLGELADNYLQECLLEKRENEMILLNRTLLNDKPRALQRRVLRKGICFVKGDLRRVTYHHVQAVLDSMDSPKSVWSKCLPGNIEIFISGNCLEIKKILKSKNNILNEGKDLKIPLLIPGKTEIPLARINLQTKIISSIRIDDFAISNNEANFDLDISGEKVLIRFYEKGDRFIPLGMSGRKKLKDFFIDEKIPQKQRYSIPILTTLKGDIIWVYGLRISDKFRVTSGTNKILNIKGLKY